MGNLARLLQRRFFDACPSGWSCSIEERIMSPGLERMLGFAPRADVLLARGDGSTRLWIEFEISRADPVANHAKFATAHLFEPRTSGDTFVSMVSPHVTRGRSNLAASAIYLMRSVGMSAFQTELLPSFEPEGIHELNQRPVDALLRDAALDVETEIERAIAVAQDVGQAQDHRIHYAANLFEVTLNVRTWNDQVRDAAGARSWGRRTVTFFVWDPRSGLFAPSKFCAFVPIRSGTSARPLDLSMDMAIYASLDESETRFDGNVARRHLTGRLALREVALNDACGELRDAFAAWHRPLASQVALHPRGPVLLLPPTWW